MPNLKVDAVLELLETEFCLGDARLRFGDAPGRVAVNQATAQVDAARSLVQLADETLRLSQVRYRGGVGTALELQDAELRDRSAHETLLSAQVGLRQSVVQLRFSAGLL